MKTLFLDFDGVLHPTLPLPEKRFALALDLAAALRGFDCDLVVSSSWRFQLPYDQLRKLLPTELSERLVGMTGEAVVGRYARHREILNWLHANGTCDWRALDDSAFEFPPDCPQLVRCDGARGITVRELTALKLWLQDE